MQNGVTGSNTKTLSVIFRPVPARSTDSLLLSIIVPYPICCETDVMRSAESTGKGMTETIARCLLANRNNWEGH